jgi:2-oxoglutarate ferredoxin oxidoreductase subunit alpha
MANERFDLVIKVGGEGGEGVITAGDFLTETAARAGYWAVNYKSYPAEIKGGYAQSTVRVSSERVFSTGDSFDILCAFNGEAVEKNMVFLKRAKDESKPKVLVYDSTDYQPAEELENVIYYPVPLSELAKDVMKAYITKNIIALGVLSELFGIPEQSIKDAIKAKFMRKGEHIVELNYKAFDLGRQYVRENLKKVDPYKFPEPKEPQDVVIMEGNQAVAKGSIAAGVQFYAAYPITPATTVGNHIVTDLIKRGGWLYQAEDEIASLGMALGASFAGKKSMTATSGPGISLMSEFISYAGITELPIVIVDVQRGGPGTGMPTKHEQADLFVCAFGGHGDFPRAILAATTVEDNFYLAVEAFNLAEKYQIPVFLMTDGALAIRSEVFPTPKIEQRPDGKVVVKGHIPYGVDEIEVLNRWIYNAEEDKEGKFRSPTGRFLRYKTDTPDGITPMGIPGDPNAMHAITGLERTENTDPRFTPEIRVKQMNKRFRKLQTLLREDADRYYKDMRIDSDNADIAIISWGLTASIAREAAQRLREQGYTVNEFYPRLLWPVKAEVFEEFASKAKRVIVPETNYHGQLAFILRATTNLKDLISYVAYRGEAFIPKEIEDFAKMVIEKDIKKGWFTPSDVYGTVVGAI